MGREKDQLFGKIQAKKKTTNPKARGGESKKEPASPERVSTREGCQDEGGTGEKGGGDQRNKNFNDRMGQKTQTRALSSGMGGEGS